MVYPEFKLERWQSLREQSARINLSESGVYPLKIDVGLIQEDLEAGYGYTNGSPELRETISHTYSGLEPDDILVTNGGAEANFTAVNALVKSGDRVCCMMPNYMQIPGILSELGAKVDYFWLKGEDFAFDEDEFDHSLRGDTKLIVLTSPNNPTGTVLNRGHLEYIVERAKRNNSYVVCDEVYRGLELSVETPPSIVEIYDRGVATSSLSKAYGLSGLRIGWVAGPREVVEKAWGVKDYSSISPSILSQTYASKILERRVELLTRAKKIVGNNSQLVYQLPELTRFFQTRLMHSCPFVFFKTKFAIDTWSYCEWIYREYGVLINPGECFELPGYVRIWLGHADSQWMKEALNSLIQATQDYAEKL